MGGLNHRDISRCSRAYSSNRWESAAAESRVRAGIARKRAPRRRGSAGARAMSGFGLIRRFSSFWDLSMSMDRTRLAVSIPHQTNKLALAYFGQNRLHCCGGTKPGDQQRFGMEYWDAYLGAARLRALRTLTQVIV